MSGQPLDREALVAELAAGLEDAEPLVRELVDDWAREADSQPDPTAVLGFQREDLDAATAEAGDRPRGLELAVLRRRLARVSAASFALAQQVHDGDAPGDAADTARAVVRQSEELAAALERFGPGAIADGMRRELGESMLDARYVLDGGVTSLRLAHARPAAGDRSPDVSP
jgi:hypothetical protein